MRAIESYKGHTILQNGCCGDVTFAVARPNGIIFARDLDSIEQAKAKVDENVKLFEERAKPDVSEETIKLVQEIIDEHENEKSNVDLQ